MKDLHNDQKGQVIPVEYILGFMISMIFLGIIVFSFNSAVDYSSKQITYIELKNTGNLISSTIIHMYVTAPCNGINSVSLDIPAEISGSSYFIEISDNDPSGNDNKVLKLTSMRKHVTAYVPLSSVDALIEIRGSASSSSGKIVIESNPSEITISQG